MTSPRGASPIASNKALGCSGERKPAPQGAAGAGRNCARRDRPRRHRRNAAERANSRVPMRCGSPARRPRRRVRPCAVTRRFILAADTVVACGRRILPKARPTTTVRACLKLLVGPAHQVLTAVALIPRDGAIRRGLVLTRVAFKRLDQSEIEAYLACGEGLGKAGGYAIQGRAETFVRQLNGSWSNVVGLPLLETVHLLKGCGVAIS
jgi:MAF protein